MECGDSSPLSFSVPPGIRADSIDGLPHCGAKESGAKPPHSKGQTAGAAPHAHHVLNCMDSSFAVGIVENGACPTRMCICGDL